MRDLGRHLLWWFEGTATGSARGGREAGRMTDLSEAIPAFCVGAGGIAVRYRRSDGPFVDTVLDRLPVDEVLAGRPVREFRSYRGRKHYSGWYFSTTMGGHVVYESRLELARILLADQDRDVVAIAAQPFLLEGADGGRVRRHVPDLLVEHADGRLSVIDVKASWLMGEAKVVAQFAWTAAVCTAHGFGFEAWSGCDPVLLENVRFLAGYRRPELIDVDVARLVLAGACRARTLREIEYGLAVPEYRGLVRPAALHLLWTGALSADLSRVLDAGTVVEAVAS